MKTIKGILIGAMLCVATTSYAQVYSTVKSASKNAVNSKESLAELVGEPYLYKDFKKAFVRFPGVEPALYEIKYDQLADEVVAKGEGDSEYAFTNQVSEFKFQDSKKVFRNGFAPVGKSTERSFYEIIFDGKVKYIKRAAKTVIEGKVYNGPVTKKVEEDYSYYLVKDGSRPELVKNNEKSILAALNKPELNAYVKTNKLNLKNDEDVAKLLAYNDSL